MVTDIEQCKHDPRAEENEILLEDREDRGKVSLACFVGATSQHIEKHGAQFCVEVISSKRNRYNPRTEENEIYTALLGSL